MSFLFESLESRRLLSNTAITTLHTDEATVRVDNKAIDALDRTTVDEIGSELISAGEFRASIGDLKTVVKQGTRDEVALTVRVDVGIAKVNLDTARLNAVALQLTLHPDNTRLQTREANDETKLTDDATTVQTDITNDSNTLDTDANTNLNALVTLNSSDSILSADVSAYETSVGTDVTTMQTDANTAFTTDVAAVVATP